MLFPVPVRRHRHLHASAEARARYGFDADLFALRGRMLVADFDGARRVAHRINQTRDTARYPESAVAAGDVFVAGLLHEIYHLVFAFYAEQVRPGAFADAIAHLEATVGEAETGRLLDEFVTTYPPPSVYRGEHSAADYLAASVDGDPNRHATIEELLLLNLANANPALERLTDLFDDGALAGTPYPDAIRALDEFFAGLPGFGGGGGSLLDLLRAPALASPTSLQGQLEFIRSNWAELLGDRFGALLERLLRALDLLEEERTRPFFGAGPPPVLEKWALADAEYEAFSRDRSWMPRLVLIAKSTYVWLDQLARLYGRDIRTLDQIPDDELDRLAAAGFTGLWLIGLWERSHASAEIKHRRGNPDAVASAYAVYDYVIAADLGGHEAYLDLRSRAAQRGIRLASDMVPNHVGIDAKWVVEHPDRFLSVDHAPYPGYTFTGPDLSPDPRVTVQIEDHYWDGSDAAVVFRRYDQATGAVRFIYHGNDGTGLPWNDTAQLDYLNPETRETVIQTILHVARMFPIIRFDAAMTLAKRHVQRLWYPQPGHGGAVPSRAQYGLSQADFDRAMPQEFWREVVDRVAAEAPDTLLLAEAFWMMEGYFVRTLGMHRVYNSAFMHMMAKEDNAGYRRLMKNVLEFDPEVLKRFVNFMNNPDEDTAVTQFGRDDKYFGVATVMATMPGLPMFGHGQVEGFTEKYGMEFRRAQLDEQPDEWLMERHRRQIFPLLHRRADFAEVDEFLLFDVVADGGGVIEDVYAFSNRYDGRASLVLYHNKYAEAAGWVHRSVPYMARLDGGRELVTRTLAEGLGLRAGDRDFVRFRDHVSGMEYLRRSREIAERGFFASLRAFEHQVFSDFLEVDDRDGALAALHDRLGGKGVPDLDRERRRMELEPLHDALRDLVDAGAASDRRVLAALRTFLEQAQATGVALDVEAAVAGSTAHAQAAALKVSELLAPVPRGPRRRFRDAVLPRGASAGALLAAWAAYRVPEVRAAAADRWLDDELRRAFSASGADPGVDPAGLLRFLGETTAAWQHAAAGSSTRRRARTAAAGLLRNTFAYPLAAELLGFNSHDGVEWFHAESLQAVIGTGLLVLLAAADNRQMRGNTARLGRALDDAVVASGYRVDRIGVRRRRRRR